MDSCDRVDALYALAKKEHAGITKIIDALLKTSDEEQREQAFLDILGPTKLTKKCFLIMTLEGLRNYQNVETRTPII